VVVAPVMADSSCCIAASHEARPTASVPAPASAKRARCARTWWCGGPSGRYVAMHHELMALIETCAPQAGSIDEVPCTLIGRERERGNAEAIARAIKQALRARYGSAIRCSIGTRPHAFWPRPPRTCASPTD
jgi:DNA polymerase-4